MNFLRTSTLAVLLAVLPLPALAADPAGRVLLATGDVSALRAGRVVRLERGSAVEPGDQLRTGAGSHLQVRMTDEGIVALRSNSTLSIDDYRFQGRTDGSENVVFRLLKGGFRTVTGLIGRVNKSAYQVNTGVATIGIRGTAFALALCDSGNCRNDNGQSARDGLYGAVTEGRIQATNRTGEASFAAGEAFYAAAPDTGFQRLLAPPSFLNTRVEGGRRASETQAASGDGDAGSRGEERRTAREKARDAISEKQADSATGSTSANGDSTTGSDADTTKKGSILAGTGILPILATEIITESGGSKVLPAPDGFIVAMPLPGGSYEYFFGDGGEARYNGFNQVTSWKKGSAGGELGAGEVIVTGGVARNGQVLSWGRWNGGQITTSGGTTIGGIPLLFVTANAVATNSFAANLPTSGTVTYAGIGGPGVSAVKGGYFPNSIFGQVVSESLTISFGSTPSANLDMTIRLASLGGHSGAPAFNHTYQFSANLGLNANSGGGDFVGSFGGSCVSGCTGSISGQASIGLTGKDGYGLAVTTGGFADSSSTLSATFVRVFEASSASGVVTTVAQ